MAVGKDTKTGKWYTKFRYHDYTGKAIQKRKIGFETKRDAQAWEKEFIAQHEGKERITFRQAYDRYLADCRARLKKTTVFIKEDAFKYFSPLHDMPLAEISAATIREFQNRHLLMTDENGVMVYTKNNIINKNTQLSSFFTWACKFCGIKSNPVKEAGTITIKTSAEKPKKPSDIWQIEDFEKFITKVEKPKYRIIYNILFFCGLRRGEVLGLRVKDVDLENGVLHIEQNATAHGMETPKTQSGKRNVSMPDQLKEELATYIGTLYKPTPNEPLFKRLNPISLTKHFRDTQRSMDMKPYIRLHDLRHSHASMLIHMGFTPDVIADRLGHANASMVLKIYGHMYPQRREEVIDAINQAIAKNKKEN